MTPQIIKRFSVLYIMIANLKFCEILYAFCIKIGTIRLGKLLSVLSTKFASVWLCECWNIH